VLRRLGDRFRPPTAYEALAIALAFLAFGSASYAAITVTGKNVKNGSLTGKDVKNSSLTTRDVKNSSLLAKDFKTGQLPQGPKGDPGAPGTNTVAHEACPSGMKLVGAAHDLCFDSASRGSMTWSDAASLCPDAGVRLPTVAEAYEAKNAGADFNFWTDGIFDETSGTTETPYVWVSLGGSVFKVDRSSGLGESVHCVATPSTG
jgi:hypothetical protein